MSMTKLLYILFFIFTLSLFGLYLRWEYVCRTWYDDCPLAEAWIGVPW